MPTFSYVGTYTGNNTNIGAGGGLGVSLTLQGTKPAAGSYRVTSVTCDFSSLQLQGQDGPDYGRPYYKYVLLNVPETGMAYSYANNYPSYVIGQFYCEYLGNTSYTVTGLSTTANYDNVSNVAMYRDNAASSAIRVYYGCVVTLEITYEYLASSITYINSAELGGSVVVGVNPVSSTARHRVCIAFGETRFYGDFSGEGATTASATIPRGWASLMSTSTSAIVSVTLETYVGDTKTGEKTGTTTIRVPDGYIPTIGNISISRQPIDPTAVTGQYIQNKSLLTVNIGACSAGWGAWITSATVTINQEGYVANFNSSWAASFNYVPYTYGTKIVSVSVTDSRQRTTTSTMSFNVIQYTLPAVLNASVFRGNSSGGADDSGTSLCVLATFSKMSFPNLDSTVTVSYKRSILPSWNTLGSLTSQQQFTSVGILDEEYSYDVRIIVTDGLSTSEYVYDIDTAACVYSILKDGKGVSFGMFAEEEGAFDVGGMYRMGRSMFNDIYPVNSVYYSSTSDNPGSILRGTWVSMGTVSATGGTVYAWRRTV